jgi:hypothetical protein
MLALLDLEDLLADAEQALKDMRELLQLGEHCFPPENDKEKTEIERAIEAAEMVARDAWALGEFAFWLRFVVPERARQWARIWTEIEQAARGGATQLRKLLMLSAEERRGYWLLRHHPEDARAFDEEPLSAEESARILHELEHGASSA